MKYLNAWNSYYDETSLNIKVAIIVNESLFEKTRATFTRSDDPTIGGPPRNDDDCMIAIICRDTLYKFTAHGEKLVSLIHEYGHFLNYLNHKHTQSLSDTLSKRGQKLQISEFLELFLEEWNAWVEGIKFFLSKNIQVESDFFQIYKEAWIDSCCAYFAYKYYDPLEKEGEVPFKLKEFTDHTNFFDCVIPYKSSPNINELITYMQSYKKYT